MTGPGRYAGADPLLAAVAREAEAAAGPGAVAVDALSAIPHIGVEAARLVPVLRLLRDRFHFESLTCETASDRGEWFELIYHVSSMARRRTLSVRTRVPRDEPVVETAEGVWPAAGLYEREIYDLFGVVFRGHGDLRRILLPPDWEGHPLRKDYVPAATYRGMRIG